MYNQLKKQQGFSLLELMIALSIGLIITGAILEIFFGGLLIFNTQSGLAKLQENARFATNFITKDARAAGFFGCDINATKMNVITNASNTIPTELDFTDSFNGLDNVAANKTYSGVKVTPGTDVLILKYASTDNICEIDTHNSTSNTFSCQANHVFAQNQPLVATDCKHNAFFLLSNSEAINTSKEVKHQLMPLSTPKNCSNNLGLGSNCVNNPHSFNSGSILPLHSIVYFVANNNFNQPALFRQVLQINAAGNLTNVAREIVEGVEDIQILYGEDSNSDGSVNFYGPLSTVDTSKILSIRLQLLLRSVESNLTDTFQQYFYNGAMHTANDNYLRKVFSTTITLRNK